MSMLVYRDTGKQSLVCAKGTLGRSCAISSGTTFSVDIKTGPAPDVGFRGYQIVLQYRNVTFVDQAGLSENAWPPCPDVGSEQNTPPSGSTPGRYVLVCKAPPPPHTYKGVLANIHFTCVAGTTGQIDIIGGGGAVVSFYDNPGIGGNRYFLASDPKTPVGGGSSKNVADAVRIKCGSGGPGGAQADADGDGCPDAQEVGYDLDPANPWDFFDPTGDGRHSIDDIIAVVSRFGSHVAADGYSAQLDRSFVGERLGPPDGDVGMLDIAAIVGLYGTDCS
jgi:hypothetical protein